MQKPMPNHGKPVLLYNDGDDDVCSFSIYIIVILNIMNKRWREI